MWKKSFKVLLLQGYNGTPKTYIATQAPLDATRADFWTMIWENQSQVIVMLMDWVEDGQVGINSIYFYLDE